MSAEGYAKDLRAAADEADFMTDVGINAFVERAGMDADTVRQLMEAETWLTPAQALEYGLATAITADQSAPVVQTAKRGIIQRVFSEAPKQEKPREEPLEEPVEETPVPINPIMKLFDNRKEN